MKHFEEIQVIGDGGFGIVTKCRDRETGEIVAIKKMKQKFTNFEECLQLKEVKSLRKIKHENVERLLQVFRENEYLYLVFELLGESLFKTIQKRKEPFSNQEVRYIMHQILSGIAIIHKQGFFHRDIKPDNILWSESDGKLKISDFGLAREIRSRPPYTEYVGTRWYRAPEIILKHPFYNSPVDIWSVGCICCELYMLKPIFPGTSETDQLFKIMSVLGTPTSNQWPDFSKLVQKRNMRIISTPAQDLQALMPTATPEAIDFIKLCLQYDPINRPSAAKLLQHRFLLGEKIPPVIATNQQTKAQTSRPIAQQQQQQGNIDQTYNYMPTLNGNEKKQNQNQFSYTNKQQQNQMYQQQAATPSKMGYQNYRITAQVKPIISQNLPFYSPQYEKKY